MEIQFGKDDESHCSRLIAVTDSSLLSSVILELQQRLINSGSIGDWSVVEIEGLEMTPTLYTPDKC